MIQNGNVLYTPGVCTYTTGHINCALSLVGCKIQ